MDSHTLIKGDNFDELPRLYIIFILENDIYKQGKPIYRVKKTIDIQDEHGIDLPYNDDCYIMYVNGQYQGDNPIGRLMHDFSASNADDMYYEKLANKMRFLKQDEEGVEMVSKIVEEYGNKRAAEAFQQGITLGKEQQAIEAAINLLTMDLGTPEQIAKAQGLPLDKVLELQKQQTINA